MLSLLLHQVDGRSHIDVLEESGSACRCWSLYPRLRSLSDAADMFCLNWRPNKPHRRFYLNYSGPVSRGRGRVRCLWRGSCCAYRSVCREFITHDFILRLNTNGLATFSQPYTLQAWPKKIAPLLRTIQPQLLS